MIEQGLGGEWLGQKAIAASGEATFAVALLDPAGHRQQGKPGSNPLAQSTQDGVAINVRQSDINQGKIPPARFSLVEGEPTEGVMLEFMALTFDNPTHQHGDDLVILDEQDPPARTG